MQCKSSCDMNLNMLKKSGRRTRRSTMSMDMYMALSRQQLVDISSFTALNAFSIISSELELLRQHIGELEDKNAKLESEKAEIEPSF
ncbi:unnamed protein product [Rhizophagus irregularis]|nr:unnamed protein product [Rhizophagus irregularis]